MDVRRPSPHTVSDIAAAIAAPARSRMLYGLMDGRPRTSTELALLANVTPSTASIHLQQLKARRLVSVAAQGKHRSYTLAGADVATALEALSVLAGDALPTATPASATSLRAARSCYDHLAGVIGVALYDRLVALGWITAGATTTRRKERELTPSGARGLIALGIDIGEAQRRRRRFAYACLDWTERRPHLGGALGAALLDAALKKKWVARERDTRALRITPYGRRELAIRFGMEI